MSGQICTLPHYARLDAGDSGKDGCHCHEQRCLLALRRSGVAVLCDEYR
jgi:hypothetical protein